MTEVKATVFSDKIGYKGDNLYNGKTIKGKTYYFYGELSTNPEVKNSKDLNYSALGKLPHLHPLKITYGDKSEIGLKGDVGRGGVDYKPQIDLHTKLAEQLGFKGRGIVKIENVTI